MPTSNNLQRKEGGEIANETGKRVREKEVFLKLDIILRARIMGVVNIKRERMVDKKKLFEECC